jgi:branched-subunit amino acid aminotransferase/4-amino-4-deoxychorismate lyase
VTTWISREERRNAASRLSRCKSFAYTAQVQARREAHAAGAHDADCALQRAAELAVAELLHLVLMKLDCGGDGV